MMEATKWLDRLERLHPLLRRPPQLSDWAARQAEIDAASRIDEAAARRVREAAAQQVERDYDNTAATWTAVVVVMIVAVLGLWLVFRVIEESRFEDCLLAHRRSCDQFLP
jgi:anti-sigma-K factor RskA